MAQTEINPTRLTSDGFHVDTLSAVPYIDCFLWVLHGNNISTRLNYYEFETKFNAIHMYNNAFTTMEYPLIELIFKNPCRMLTGCPFIPIEKTNNKKYVYLPPMTFGLNTEDQHPAFINNFNSIGLYYLRLGVTNTTQSHKSVFKNPTGSNKEYPDSIDDSCIIYSAKKILNWTSIAAQYRCVANPILTYSLLFNLIKNNIPRINDEFYSHGKQINIAEVIVGLFVCQSRARTTGYIPDINRYFPRRIEHTVSYPSSPNISSLVGDMEDAETESESAVLLVVNSQPKLNTTTRALVGITTQGCALNVFATYGLIDESIASEQVACLPSTGTSIFRILDVLHNYINPENTVMVNYSIYRYHIQDAINIICLSLLSATITNYLPIVVILKIYDHLYFPIDTTTLSHVGHTISIYRHQRGDGTDKIGIFDPQGQIHRNWDHNLDTLVTDCYEFILDRYASKVYGDLIFVKCVGESPPILQHVANVMPFSKADLTDNLLAMGNAYIVTRPPNMTFGGSRQKSISKKSKSKNKKTKSISRSKQIDPYIKLVQDLDKKHHIPTLIRIETK